MCISHLPGHPDIFWGPFNFLDPLIEEAATELLRERFGREEVLLLLEVVDEYGFERGTIGQAAHSIIGVVRNRVQILESIAYDAQIPADLRYNALLLLIYSAQRREDDPAPRSLHYIDNYIASELSGEHYGLLVELRRTIHEFGALTFY